MVTDDVVPGFQDVQRYLAARGWRSSLSKRPNLAIWRSSDEAEEVLVPLSRAFADYASTMRTVATRVAAHEQRSTEAVLRDLVQLQSDTLRIGLVGEGSRGGTAPLSAGVELLEAVRAGLLASACFVKRPQRSYPRMSFGEALEFVQACRLGQTEVGSFVLSVATPLVVASADPRLTPHFGRLATEAFMRSSRLLAQAVRAGEEARLVDPASAVLVSANFARALVDMAPRDESADLRLSATWSPLVVSDVDASSLLIERELFEGLERVADQLRPQTPVHPTRVIAVVSELRGVANEQGALEGEVVLTSLLKGGPRRLRVSLSAADYRLAGQAHLAQQVVSVCGRVVRHGRTVELVEPERLVIEELVEPDDL